MAKTVKAVTENKFKLAKFRAEILEDLYSRLEDKLKDTTRYYGKTGEQKQKERWNRELEESEKVFDDDGNPVMEDVYDYVPYTEEELENYPDERIKGQAVRQVMEELEQLL